MIHVDSVQGVNTQHRKYADQSALLAGIGKTGNNSSEISFSDLLKLYTKTAEGIASADPDDSGENGVYMGYYLPLFMMNGTDVKAQTREPESDSQPK